MALIFPRLRIATKLWLGFGVVAALLASVSLVQVLALRRDGREVIILFEKRMVPVRQLKSVSTAYVQDIVNTARLVRGGSVKPEEGLHRVQQARAMKQQEWAAYRSSLQPDDDWVKVRGMEHLMAKAEPGLDYLEVLLASADLARLGRYVDEELLPSMDPILKQLDVLSRSQELAGRAQVEASSSRVERTQTIAIIMILCGFVVALILAHLITKDLGRRVARLVDRMKAAAHGDLKQVVVVEGNDELATMGSVLNHVIGRLREYVLAMEQDARNLRLSEAQAQAANKAKSAFLSNMSHELRTPLNAIIGYGELMNRDPERSATDKDQLRHILHAGEHLLGLINEVLSLAKIESGGIVLKPTPFSTDHFFQALAALFEMRASHKGVAFVMDVHPGFPGFLLGDEGKLRQVLVNLLSNAIKFTEQGSVTLGAWYRSGMASFEVKDTGPGISEADLGRLFEQFFQAGGPQSAAEGTGLGLHISQALIHLMGGEISVISQLGFGSTFSFQVAMPESEVAIELEDGGEVLSLEPGQKPFSLLVVDDREENRELLTQLFQAVGFTVRSAKDGQEALESWQKEPPDLVWMDLRMPRMDGFEAIARMREMEADTGLPRTPVVAISASVIDLDKESVQQHGFDDFLGKPFRESVLFQLLSEHLGVRFSRRSPAAEPTAFSAPVREELADLTPTWRYDFHQAIASGDTQAAQGLIDTLPDEALALRLRQMVKAYRLEELLTALKT